MNTKALLALSIQGLEPKEFALTTLLVNQSINQKYGEVFGRNLRSILELTKESLFQLLEKLIQKNILQYSQFPETCKQLVYIRAGDGCYILNEDFTSWIPCETSLFYKLCKLYGYAFNQKSYQLILDELDLTQELVKKDKSNEGRITPYELYDIFCQQYKKIFNQEYVPPNQARDFMNLKKIIYQMSYNNFSDQVIRDFIRWCFDCKVKDFKGNFIIGFLPMCLVDYLRSNVVEKNSPIYKRDEDGRLRKE